MPIDAIPCPSAYMANGDSLRCGSTRLRLLGIDAPELHGCRHGERASEAGDGKASRQSLKRGVGFGPIAYQQVTYDCLGAQSSSRPPMVFTSTLGSLPY